MSFPQSDYDYRWSASGWGPFCQGTLGASILLGDFSITPQIGYRFSWDNVDEQDVQTTQGNYKRHEHWNIGESGVVMLVSFGMTL